MAEIDADELEADIIAVRSLNIYECVPSLRYVAQAAGAHLASLRAPKGELEEARAELGAAATDLLAWLAQTPEPVEPSDPVLTLYAAWSHTAEAESADFITTFRGGYRAGLAADQTTARESAESTAEETMTNRCDTKQGPCACGAWHDAQTPVFGPKNEAERAVFAEEESRVDSEILAQTPEPVEPSDGELERIFNAGADDIVYASGPDGEELPDTRATVANGHRALYRAGLAAEAAARDRDIGTWRRTAERLQGELSEAKAELERVRAELATEKSVASQAETDHVKSVRETRRLLDDIAIALHGWSADTCKTYVPGQLASLAASLRAQARARRVPPDAELQEALSRVLKGYGAEVTASILVDMADAVLRLFAEAPPIGVEELAEALRSVPRHPSFVQGGNWRSVHDDHWPAYARAAMTALGFQDSPKETDDASQVANRVLRADAERVDQQPARTETVVVGAGPVVPLVTSDNEPPDPLPAVLPVGTRSRHGSVSDTSVCLRTERGSHAYWGRWNLVIGTEQCVPAEDIDWSHYRAQQRAAEATPEATWNYEAPPDSEIGKVHELLDSEHAQAGLGSVMRYTGRDRDGDPAWDQGHRILGWSVAAWRPASAAPESESDSAWLKRTVEELTTARPVEVIEDALGHLHVSTTGDGEAQRVSFRAYVDERHVEGIRSILAGKRWPMRRNAKPAEPSPQPGGFLDALTRRVEALELQARVTRRILALDYPTEWNREGHAAYVVARIEREEREGQSNKP